MNHIDIQTRHINGHSHIEMRPIPDVKCDQQIKEADLKGIDYLIDHIDGPDGQWAELTFGNMKQPKLEAEARKLAGRIIEADIEVTLNGVKINGDNNEEDQYIPNKDPQSEVIQSNQKRWLGKLPLKPRRFFR